MSFLSLIKVNTILITFTFLIPIFKQFVFVSTLDTSSVGVYGFLFAISMIIVGIGNIGTLEVANISSSINKSLKNKKAFFFYKTSIWLTILVASLASVFILFYMDVGWLVGIIFLINTSLLYFFQVILRFVRSLGVLKLFFRITVIKLLLDMVTVSFFYTGDLISLETIFLVDILSISVVIIFLLKSKFMKCFLKRIFYSFTCVNGLIRENISTSLAFFSISGLSLFIVNIDRLVFFESLSQENYQKFLYLAIVLSLFYGMSAFLHTVIHRSLAKNLNKKEGLTRWIVGKVSQFKLLLFLFPVVVVIMLTIFFQYFVSNVVFSFIEVFIVVLIGVLHLYNIFEKVLYLKASLLLNYMQLSYLICFLLLFLGLKLEGLMPVLVMYLILKVIYFFGSFYIYRYRY